MILPDNVSFTRFIYDFANKSFLDNNSVDPVLFIGAMGHPIAAIPIRGLMAGEEEKDIVSWIPAYLSLLGHHVDLIGLAIESWMVDSETLVEKLHCTPAEAVKQANDLLKQYGSVSNFPEDLRKSTLMVNIERIDQKNAFLWDIHEDGTGRQLESFESISEKLQSGSMEFTGRFYGLINKCGQLKQAFEVFSEDEYNLRLAEANNVSPIQALSMAICAQERSAVHANACNIAMQIYASMPKQNHPHQAKTVQ